MKSKETQQSTDLSSLAKIVASEAKINPTITQLFDNGGLDNWKGVSNLPEKLIKAFPDIGNKPVQELLLANIFARAARNFSHLFNNQSKLTELALPDNRRQQLLNLAVLFYSYPQGIEPTNQTISLQIEESQSDKLENFFRQLGSFRQAVKDLGFTKNQNSRTWTLITNPSQLEEKIGRIVNS